MTPLELDYQPRPFPARGLVLLLLGLVAAVLAALAERQAAADAAYWQSELARAQQAAQRQSAVRQREEQLGRGSQEFQQALQAAAVVADELRRPWEALFAALEAAQSDDIALLRLDPDAARGVVTLTGEAKAREAILAYVARLDGEPALKNVVLLEDRLLEEQPEQPYRFLLSAEWAGPS